MKTQSHKKQMNVGRILKTPMRAVSKAFDSYVKGITNLTISQNKPSRTYTTTTSTPDSSQQLPRSFSTSRIPYNNYEEPPVSALVRSISTAPRSTRSNQFDNAQLERYMMQQRSNKLQSYAASKRVPKSSIAMMGKIEEDKAASFKNDNTPKTKIDNKNKVSLYSD